jgi:hypothetical protein
MAKIKVTRRTFSAKVAETMDNAEGIEGMLAKALVGKGLKEYLSQQPDNMPLWVDTSKVVCMTDLITETAVKRLQKNLKDYLKILREEKKQEYITNAEVVK